MSHLTIRTPSRYSACVLAIGVSVTLAGCLGSPNPPATGEPDPTAISAASECSPETALIQWDEKFVGASVPVGAYVSPFAADGTVEDTTTIDREIAPEFLGDGLNQFTDFDADARGQWEELLLADARRTGQVERDFGELSPLAAKPGSLVSLDNPGEPGTGVQVVSHPETSMTFEITCGDADPVTGTLRAVENDSTSAIFYVCDDLPEPATVESEYAGEICAAL
jgi:hypothetical protein